MNQSFSSSAVYSDVNILFIIKIVVCLSVCVFVVTGFLWSEWITDFSKKKEHHSRI